MNSSPLFPICEPLKRRRPWRWAAAAGSLRRAYKQLIKPAMPILLSLTCSSIVGLSDAYLAGRIGTESLAAMAFCEQFWFLLSIITVALGSGITVGLSAKEHTAAKRQQFLLDALFVGAIVGGALWSASWILAQVLRMHPAWLNGQSGQVAGYFQVCCYSMPAFTIVQSQCAAFRACNRNGCVLRVWLIATIIEICLANLAFLFGCRSLPALAASWGIGCFVAMVEGFRLLSPTLHQVDLSAYKSSHAHGSHALFMAQIGLPIALSELGLLASSFINLHMISLLPQANTLEAAWAIKTRLEEFANVVPVCAIAMAVTPFVARYWQSSWRSKRLWAKNNLFTAIALSALLPALLCTVLPGRCAQLVQIFTTEAAVQEKTCIVLILSSLAWPFFTVAQLFFSALAGAGKTFIPSILTLVCILPLRFGLALVLKDYPGLDGVAALTVSGVIAQAVLAAGMLNYFFATMKEPTARRSVPSTAPGLS